MHSIIHMVSLLNCNQFLFQDAVQSHPPITNVKWTNNLNQHSSGAATVIQKPYLRNTNQGKVQKLCRENYLQNNIPCWLCGGSDCLWMLLIIQLDLASQEPHGQDNVMEIEETSKVKKNEERYSC